MQNASAVYLIQLKAIRNDESLQIRQWVQFYISFSFCVNIKVIEFCRQK